MSGETWNTAILGGSIKRKIVNPDLIEERAKCNFNQQELAEFVAGKDNLDEMRIIKEEILKDPNLQTGLSFYKMTREEQHANWWRIISAAYNNPRLREPHFTRNSERKSLSFAWSYMFPGISIIHLH